MMTDHAQAQEALATLAALDPHTRRLWMLNTCAKLLSAVALEIMESGEGDEGLERLQTELQRATEHLAHRVQISKRAADVEHIAAQAIVKPSTTH